MAVSDTTGQYVDPEVSRIKFEREIAEYRSLEVRYRARGWFLMKADWPVVTVVLASSKTNPPAIVMAVRFDFTNYDAEPPSVRVVDPFTERILLSKELRVRLIRTVPGPEVPFPIPGGGQIQLNVAQDLMQAHSPEEAPFLCIAGVKEYHDHPGHSGDPWEIHRSSGAGRLVRLLETISRYGLDPIQAFSVSMEPRVTFLIPDPKPL